MDKLRDCALMFEKLLGFDYKIKAGRNGKVVDLTIFFLAEHFHHLIGLQKLIDLPQVSRNRNKKNIFQDILQGRLTYEEIKKSHYISEVDKRILYFSELEKLLFNKIIIRYDKRKAFTKINATMLLFNQKEEIYLHLFLAPFNYNKDDLLIPISFFSSTDGSNVERQERYTVLRYTKEPRKSIK